MIARVIAGIAAGSILASCTAPQQLTQFERTLAAQDSATAALTDWCQQQGIARPARISAVGPSETSAASIPIATTPKISIGQCRR